MKKGICQLCYPENMRIKECMEIAKGAGFDGIELSLLEKGEFSLETTEQELRETRKLADDIGIELNTFSIEFPCHLTSDEETERKRDERAMVKSLEIASMLGAEVILTVPGGVVQGEKIVSYDLVYERAVVALKALSKVAEKNGVCIGVHNVWDKFLLNPLEFKRLIDEVNAKYVKAYFDIGNVLVNGYPEQWIRILDKRIIKVHFSDFKRSIGNINGFCNLLEGDVDWPEVMRALKEIGYDDYVTAEVCPPYTYYPEALIYNTSRAMDKILKGR